MRPEQPPAGPVRPGDVEQGAPGDPAADAASRRSRRLAVAAVVNVVLVLVVVLVGMRAGDDRRRSGGGDLAATTTAGSGAPPTSGPVTLAPEGGGGGATTPSEPASPLPPGPGPGPTAAPGPGPATPPASAPVGLRLGGNDLGVTRVGAPIREAVAAVAGALGPPLGDPATDSGCVGAEEETSWEGFRLGSTGGRVSGWRSTSPALTTPAGAAVGTTLAGLRRAYGAALEVRPPEEPGDPPVFLVASAGLGGTLTGSAPTDTVTSIANGTCEAV